MELLDKKVLLANLMVNNDGRYNELIEDIENGKFDYANYRALCRNFIGVKIQDFFCNGFFGSRNYDLEGAEIRGFKETEDCITVEVFKEDGYMDYGYFDDHWCDWKIVYDHLETWTKEQEE